MTTAGPWDTKGACHCVPGKRLGPGLLPSPNLSRHYQLPSSHGTLNEASMWSTTGQGESLISHSRSWLIEPGTPPVRFNSKPLTSLGSGEEEDIEVETRGGDDFLPGQGWI